ncbi:MAG: NAD-glutamate dehydrogenase [Propioniciclava sp.]
MNTEASQESTGADVERLLRSFDPDLARIAGLVAGWLSPHNADSVVAESRLAARLIATQARLGWDRQSGDDLVRVITPTDDSHRWSAGGSTVVQIVTDDRPFLVDTTTMALTELGWTIRAVHHPVLSVVRSPAGQLDRIGEGERSSRAESWLTILAYPPLGTAAAAQQPILKDRIHEGLAASRRAYTDAGAMAKRLQGVIDWLESAPWGEADRAAAFLSWVADRHFEILGYRSYVVRGDEFVLVPGSGLGLLRGDTGDGFNAVPTAPSSGLVVVTRDSQISPVHRARYLDYVGVRITDPDGSVVGEHRFLGLWSMRALAEPVDTIPVVGERVLRIRASLGVTPDTHAGQVFAEAVAALPHQEWFQGEEASLTEATRQIIGVLERGRPALVVSPGPYFRFWTCLVFVPRDRYRTSIREQIVAILSDVLDAEDIDFSAVVGESALARLTLVVKRPDHRATAALDWEDVQARVIQATRIWDDDFNDLAAGLGAEQRGVEFGASYQDVYTAAQALADLKLANSLRAPGDLKFMLDEPDDPEDPAALRFKIITRAEMSLTQLMPHLTALGVGVLDERPFVWDLRGEPLYLYDLGLELPPGRTAADVSSADRERFADAFAASWRGDTHPGGFNRLVMAAQLSWREVSWLRGIARFLQQAGIPYSQPYTAEALNSNPDIAASLVAAFRARFDPAVADARREAEYAGQLERLTDQIDAVQSLDQDRILRMFVAVLASIVRTNAFVSGAPVLAFKLRSADLDLLPAPRPPVEVFVTSPRVLGVHLRFGLVARGGLRWSDRREDVRTEVLGLVRAQRVKNTVIVPEGAKGGFVPLQLPDPQVDRAAWLAEGEACYDLFIDALIGLADNLVDGAVVPPVDVVRHDGDDTYLVVAADKGTATFSDRANRIALARGYWLGDAFASGGSIGYDHKAMGITARGAWESVRRHFYELGVDCQQEDFTCVGIGDMAGDVFGNGMLLSTHLRLVGAFNHAHIFLDPDPQAAAGFAERQRLFDLPGSTWADYDRSLLSPGGGVWPRTVKSIPISPEARAALGLDSSVIRLSPDEVIRAVLLAPVDLLWNGGIGTYVKGSAESDTDVGDKANDPVRVTGSMVRARVAGEGGNLGWTEAGRVEFARCGGRINTDFIDNSAGVDTSDHEVNIKVLLQPATTAGRLEAAERRSLLGSMTAEVAGLVLAHNVDQNVALSVEQAIAVPLVGAYESWMVQLEAAGVLDRALAGLPDAEEMAHRAEEGATLLRPELASLLSWTKLFLKREVLASTLPDDPYVRDRLVTYFPRALQTAYAQDLEKHSLAREIVTTVTVNRFVNSAGVTAFARLAGETSSTIEEIVRAQLAVRSIFSVAQDEVRLPELRVDAMTDVALRAESRLMVERATRWLLTSQRGHLDVAAATRAYTAAVQELDGYWWELMTPRMREQAEETAAGYLRAGVGEALARRAGLARVVHLALPMVKLAQDAGRPLVHTGQVFFMIADRLGIDRVLDRVDELPRATPWDTIARAALREDALRLLSELVRQALAQPGPADLDAPTVVAAWEVSVGGVERDVTELHELTEAEASLARMTVAVRTLRSLLL